MNINYELVYNLTDYEKAIFQAQNKVRIAENEVEQSKTNYRNWVAKETKIPVEDLQFTNEGCLAKGIAYHVYHIKIKGMRYGSPENKCVFCGCDNVSD